jgi:hypothetical protein
MNYFIALGAWWSSKDITGRNRTAILWQRERWPRSLAAGKILMGLLHLFACEVPYDVQIRKNGRPRS